MIDQYTEGHVVNTASLAGLISLPFVSGYHTTKHAVVTISESLQYELALRSAGESVGAVPRVCQYAHDGVRTEPSGAAPSTGPTPGDRADMGQCLPRVRSDGSATRRSCGSGIQRDPR